MNANTIIKKVLKKLLVISGAKEPSTQQYADGLETLNDMVRSWSGNLNLTYEEVLEELIIPPNTQNFTIGSTGDQATVRPLQITHVSLREGNTEYPLRRLDKTQYQSVTDKTTTGLPYGLHYRNTFPDGTIYFSHTTDKQYTLILSSLKELTDFPDGTTEISLPAYYEKAFKDNLLIEWASELGAAKRITQLMMQMAEESKSTIVGQSIKMNASTTELRSRGVYNIQADSY